MKRKWIWIFLLLFLFVGCQDEGTTLDSFTTNQMTTEALTSGPSFAFQLVYPDETIEIEGEIGTKVIIPELMKDDYIFIGWTDGENHYAGLTEIQEKGIVLTPDYLSVESVFERVEVSMGQVSLIGYHGESTIVGIPTYWNDYLVVGFTSDNLNITKLYIPTSMGYMSVFPYNDLTDVVMYGEQYGFLSTELISGSQFEQLIESCTYADGTPFDIENPVPGMMDEGCPIHVLIERNDDEAVTVPGKGTFYTYDVVMSQDFWYATFIKDGLHYLSYQGYVGFEFIQSLYQQGYRSLEVLDLESNDRFHFEEHQISIIDEGVSYLVYIDSNDEVLSLDLQEINIYPYIMVNGDIQTINISHEEYWLSIDGVLYQEYMDQNVPDSDEIFLMLMVYPNGKQDTSFEFPSLMNEIRQDVLVEGVETLTLNAIYDDLHILMRHFPNIQTIHIPEDHLTLIEEDGLIYDKNKEALYLYNESIEELVIQSSVVSIRNMIFFDYGLISIDHLHLSEGVTEDFINSGLHYIDPQLITIDENNPYLNIEDGIIYNSDYSKILYINPNISDLYIRDEVEEINVNLRNLDDLTTIHINARLNDSILEQLKECESLETITISSLNPHMKVVDDIVYNQSLSELMFVPPAVEIEEVLISQSVYMIDDDAFIYNEQIERFVVAENHTYFQSIDGIIYDKDVENILHIPRNYTSTHYQMPDTLIYSRELKNQMYLEDFLSKLDSIYIGKNYRPIIGDPLTDLLYLVDLIDIHSDSAFYDETYHIIISLRNASFLDQTTLYAFVGDKKTYELPDDIYELSGDIFQPALSLEHLIVDGSLPELPIEVFGVEALKSITIKGDTLLFVEGFSDSEFLNELGDNYIYYFGSSDLIVYVEASMVQTYQNHPFWSLYDIRPIE